MSFEPYRVPPRTVLFRGLGTSGQIDRKRDPWGVTLKAFFRKRKDDDGLTVLPQAHLCCEIELLQIAKIDVAEIEKLINPITGEHLYVWRDSPDHACIPNLPFHDEFPQEANDLATDLASAAEILTPEEFTTAKKTWANRSCGASEDHQQE